MLLTLASAHSRTRPDAAGANSGALIEPRAATLTLLPVCTQAGNWKSIGPDTSSPRQPFLQFDLQRSASAGAMPPGAPATRSRHRTASGDGCDIGTFNLVEPLQDLGQETSIYRASAPRHASHIVADGAEALVSTERRQHAEGVQQPLSAAAVSGDGKPKQALEPGEAPQKISSVLHTLFAVQNLLSGAGLQFLRLFVHIVVALVVDCLSHKSRNNLYC